MSAFEKMAANSGGGGEGGDFEAAPAGNHPAVLIGLIELGTQQLKGYNGEPPTEKEQVFLVWELTTKKMTTAPRNFTVGHAYTASLHTKARLRKDLEKWFSKKLPDGQGIAWEKLLGKACLLTVSHSTSADGDKTFVNVDGPSALIDGLNVPPAQLPHVYYKLDTHGEPPPQAYLPFIFGKSVGQKIRMSREWVQAHGQQPAQNGQAVQAHGQQPAPTPAAPPPQEDAAPF